MNVNFLAEVDFSSANWMGILWCALIGVGLGLILGLILFLCGHFLEVKEDERVAAVEKLLPGYNCGSCGHAGCHEMAEAIVKGEVKKLSLCRPGKKDKNYDPIIAYMSAHPDEDGTLHVPEI